MELKPEASQLFKKIRVTATARFKKTMNKCHGLVNTVNIRIKKKIKK